MKFRMKRILTVCLLVMLLVLISGCAAKLSPYESNDEENYSVSVKFDANGGFFTTNTYTIVDSYNITEMQTGSSGKVEIPLLSPDDENRGVDAFPPAKSGHFLAGWYAERTETTDNDGKTVYSYAHKWDFDADRLEVDPNGTYTSKEPVLTLYAVWIPLFEVEYVDLSSGEIIGTKTFDPTVKTEIVVPTWDTTTGEIVMNDFATCKGYTFNAAYFDAEGTRQVTTETITHPGKIDYATGTAADTSMKVYVDLLEGEWFHIYTAEQFRKNASVTSNYVICADLDFSDEIWPTSFMYGSFKGTIQGNGCTISNVHVTQTDTQRINAGLFGTLAEGASISDVSFENVTFTIKAGFRNAGTSYGLFAGSISSEAVLENVSIATGTIEIDSGCYLGTSDYSIGLICGIGDPAAVNATNVSCVAVGENPETLNIVVHDNEVTVTKVE